MEKLNKIAQITLIFWLMKIVATTLGETLGNFIAQTIDSKFLKNTISFYQVADYLYCSGGLQIRNNK